MEEQRFNSSLRNKLQDLESPFNDRVSFEAVMKKREKKKRRVVFWIPSLVVVAGLFIAQGMGWLMLDSSHKAEYLPKTSISKAIIKKSIQSLNAKSIQDGNAKQLNDVKIASNNKATAAWVAVKAKSKGLERFQSSVVGVNNENPNQAVHSINIPTQEGNSLQISQTIGLENNYRDLLCNPQGIVKVPLGISKYAVELTEIPEGEFERAWDPEMLKSKIYFEISATTGSRVVLNFNEDDRLSVLGSMYHANYHGLLLKDVGKGFMLGAGLSYGEWIGTGEWREREFQQRMSIDTYDLVVMLPPVQTVRVYDTTLYQERIETIGEIAYRIDKIALPLAARYHFSMGKMSWRVAVQLNPGMTLKTSGDFFGTKEFAPIQQQRMLTMDVKVAAGPSIAVYKDWLLILEPNMMRHTFRDQAAGKTRSKTLTGFGVSVLHRF